MATNDVSDRQTLDSSIAVSRVRSIRTPRGERHQVTCIQKSGDRSARRSRTARGERYRFKFIAGAGAALILTTAVAGCSTTDGAETSTATAETSAPTATPTPTPSATLTERQQQIKAAERALRDYVIASDAASRTLESDDLTLMKMVTPEWWSESIVPELNRNFHLKEVLTGNTELVSVRPVKVDLDGAKKSAKFRVCKDVTGIRYVKAEGKDKGKVTYNPNKGDTPRFEMTYTFVHSERLDRWRLSRYSVPLDENGEKTPC